MAVTYVASNIAPAYPGGSSGNTSSITITKPTGTVDGDVMIAVVCTGFGAVVSSPAGWNLIDVWDNGSNLKCTTWYKVAASEGASYNFTDDSGGSLPLNGSIQTYRGVDTSAPINTSATGTATTTDPLTTPSVTTTERALLVNAVVARYATALNLATKGTHAAATSNTVRSNQGNRGASTQYFGTVQSTTADTVVTPGVKTGISFDADANHAPTNSLSTQIALREYVAPATPAAGAVSAATTAYAPSTIVSTTSESAAALATAYNASVLTGVAAENTGFGGATVTAYNAAGWVIHPVNVGVQAFDASVAITTEAGYAAASVGVSQGNGYFGAPESRRWRIAPEDRSWRIEAESRTWTIPPEDN